MRREIAEIPEAARRLLTGGREDIARAARRIAAADPACFLTVGRGSSDHAAAYLKYVIEIALGRPVASIGPSVVTVWETALAARGTAALALSQSGASPDICRLSAALGAGGAEVVALTNTPGSPLAAAAGSVIDIAAGPERAVAATKSFVNSVIAGLALVDALGGGLGAALDRLPDRLDRALAAGDDGLADWLAGTDRLVVLGRGPGLGLAAEAALKTMEVCGVGAMPYSLAEVLHGPATILRDGFPVLVFAAGLPPGALAPLDRHRAQGADIRFVPAAGDGDDLVAPLAQIVPFYLAAERAARLKGRDPDRPAGLLKETKTL